MAIRRRAYSVDGARLPYVVLIVAAAMAMACSGQTADPRAVLLDSYDPNLRMTPAEAQKTAMALDDAIRRCTDEELTRHMRYRMAVLCFHTGSVDEARTRFEALADSGACSMPIRLASLNMLGHVNRMAGQDAQAFTAFARLVSLVEAPLAGQTQAPADTSTLRLACLALFSRAEICEIGGRWAEGIAEYRRLLTLLKEGRSETMSQRYSPLATDRLCQLLLRTGQIEEYVETARTLAATYPQYHRSGLVALEMQCVKFLQVVEPQADFANGGFDAPARAIAALRSIPDRSVARSLLLASSELCEKYKGTRSGLILAYHYAWILDSLGNASKAAVILRQVWSADAKTLCKDAPGQSVIRMLQGYAMLQHAVITLEQGNCKEALAILNGLGSEAYTPHIDQLRQFTAESATILMREVKHGTQ